MLFVSLVGNALFLYLQVSLGLNVHMTKLTFRVTYLYLYSELVNHLMLALLKKLCQNCQYYCDMCIYPKLRGRIYILKHQTQIYFLNS